jgi:hypothetical protein
MSFFNISGDKKLSTFAPQYQPKIQLMKLNHFVIFVFIFLLSNGCEKNAELKAGFKLNYPTVLTNTIVAATNTSLNASTYIWNDGNGNETTDVDASFTYSEPGTYHIVLTAFSASGDEQDTVTDSVIVNVPTGKVVFWQNGSVIYTPQVKVTIGNQTETITSYYSNGVSACDMRGCANFTLPVGTYNFHAQSGSTSWDNQVDITQGGCFKMRLGW